MSQIVILDTSVLGLVTNPHGSSASLACAEWIDSLNRSGDLVVLPEISDYEVRRELLRAGKRRGLQRLNDFCEQLIYLPLTTPCMRLAAQLWADARQQGRPTAANTALDADVILAAQGIEADREFGLPAVVATDNVNHLSRFVDARRWEDIHPSQPPV